MNPDLLRLWSDLWPLLLASVLGSLLGAVSMAIFGSRNAFRHYRRGCRDTENRLIGTIRDRRHDHTSARLPHTPL